MVCIYQPPNAHVRISRILLGNAMAAAAVKKFNINTFGGIETSVTEGRSEIAQNVKTQCQFQMDLWETKKHTFSVTSLIIFLRQNC
jgi:hypothetical protein